MRLICPNCDAQYEVDNGAIPHGGRDVQCSNCGHAWFQMPADVTDDEDDIAVAEAERAAPPVAEPPARGLTTPHTTGVIDVPPPPPAAPLPPQAAPLRRTLDENLLAVLREEAAREAAERRAEASRPIETQPDLGPLESPARAPLATIPAAAPVPEEPDHRVSQRPNARRDLLPDIEEINSTLRPGSEARDAAGTALVVPMPRPKSFRAGFFSVLLVALVLVVLYATAPQIGARFPQAAPTLTAYVTTVDALRVWLDGLMQSAAGGLRNLTGEG